MTCEKNFKKIFKSAICKEFDQFIENNEVKIKYNYANDEIDVFDKKKSKYFSSSENLINAFFGCGSEDTDKNRRIIGEYIRYIAYLNEYNPFVNYCKQCLKENDDIRIENEEDIENTQVSAFINSFVIAASPKKIDICKSYIMKFIFSILMRNDPQYRNEDVQDFANLTLLFKGESGDVLNRLRSFLPDYFVNFGECSRSNKAIEKNHKGSLCYIGNVTPSKADIFIEMANENIAKYKKTYSREYTRRKRYVQYIGCTNSEKVIKKALNYSNIAIIDVKGLESLEFDKKRFLAEIFYIYKNSGKSCFENYLSFTDSEKDHMRKLKENMIGEFYIKYKFDDAMVLEIKPCFWMRKSHFAKLLGSKKKNMWVEKYINNWFEDMEYIEEKKNVIDEGTVRLSKIGVFKGGFSSNFTEKFLNELTIYHSIVQREDDMLEGSGLVGYIDLYDF